MSDNEVIEYPRWVKPHPSHLVYRTGGNVIAPPFLQVHADRDGVVTVLVDDASEEARAVAPKVEAPGS